MYTGTIIKESLENPEILKSFDVVSESYSEDVSWHLYNVVVSREQIDELSIVLKKGTWYAHFWYGDNVVVAFKNKTFEFSHKDRKSWQPATEYGKSIGIPEEQLDFPIN